MTMPSQNRNWISMAEQASVERDPVKLAILVERLCCALNDRGTRTEDETKRAREQIVASCPGSPHTAGSINAQLGPEFGRCG
jgi:hypothetical protein